MLEVCVITRNPEETENRENIRLLKEYFPVRTILGANFYSFSAKRNECASVIHTPYIMRFDDDEEIDVDNIARLKMHLLDGADIINVLIENVYEGDKTYVTYGYKGVVYRSSLPFIGASHELLLYTKKFLYLPDVIIHQKKTVKDLALSTARGYWLEPNNTKEWKELRKIIGTIPINQFYAIMKDPPTDLLEWAKKYGEECVANGGPRGFYYYFFGELKGDCVFDLPHIVDASKIALDKLKIFDAWVPYYIAEHGLDEKMIKLNQLYLSVLGRPVDLFALRRNLTDDAKLIAEILFSL